MTGCQHYNNGDNVISVPENAKNFGVMVKWHGGGNSSLNHFSAKYRYNILSEIEKSYDWREKTWVCLGDSLTARPGLGAVKKYFNYISMKTGINIINKGVSGNGYVQYFFNAVAVLNPNDFDFITIFGSGNDIRYTLLTVLKQTSWEDALGDIDDVAEYPYTSNGTICGYMNATIDKFYEVCPLNKIGIVTPTPWKNGTYIEELTDAETHRRLEMYSNKLV